MNAYPNHSTEWSQASRFGHPQLSMPGGVLKAAHTNRGRIGSNTRSRHHMHAGKVILLLLLTLAIMRFVSWALGWLPNIVQNEAAVDCSHIECSCPDCIRMPVVTQRLPGKLIALSALTFGIVVFAFMPCSTSDGTDGARGSRAIRRHRE